MLKVIVPTLNAAAHWGGFAAALKAQSARLDQVIVIDSESTDATVQLAEQEGFRVVRIARRDFGHGITRQLAASLAPDAEVLVYMTQDAVLANTQALDALLRPFEDDRVGAVYGRQLPREGAGHIEAHARVFNYPATSEVRSMENARHRGFKAIFFSNSFGAYRRKALEEVGGFPKDVNFGEDTVVAGHLLLAGWKIAYAADAEVYHSHSYSICEEFQRYLRVGELHVTQPWMIEEFGGTSGEGIRFVQSECRYLARIAPHLIPSALIRSAGKILGYRLGRKSSARS
jgi:rhamnosyltransferase